MNLPLDSNHAASSFRSANSLAIILMPLGRKVIETLPPSPSNVMRSINSSTTRACSRGTRHSHTASKSTGSGPAISASQPSPRLLSGIVGLWEHSHTKPWKGPWWKQGHGSDCELPGRVRRRQEPQHARGPYLRTGVPGGTPPHPLVVERYPSADLLRWGTCAVSPTS